MDWDMHTAHTRYMTTNFVGCYRGVAGYLSEVFEIILYKSVTIFIWISMRFSMHLKTL